MPRRLTAPALAIPAALGLALVAARPGVGQPDDEEPPLPTERPVITVEAQESSIFRLGVPELLGDGVPPEEGAGVLRRDFQLMPGYRVIGPESVRHDPAARGLDLDPGPWAALSANGVIKGEVRRLGDGRVEARLRFFRTTSTTPALERTWSGARGALRGFLHRFGNDVLAELTGRPGPFGTRLVFARREGPGRKDVWTADMDGHDLRQVTHTDGDGVAMLPAFAPDGRVWFTRLTTRGMYITHADAPERRILSGRGLHMAPSICDGRVFFTSSRDGNSEIYSARPDGSDIRRLTRHPALDLSPACGPTGKVAFVSTRHGSPQIFVMNADGTGLRRVTFRGSHNQTPAWCPDPDRPLLAFTGRDENYDVFTLDLGSNEYTRVTQGQGDNKDPAFSPDCRVLAFVSDRRGAPGVYLADRLGFQQIRVVEGAAETLEWR